MEPEIGSVNVEGIGSIVSQNTLEGCLASTWNEVRCAHYVSIMNTVVDEEHCSMLRDPWSLFGKYKFFFVA